LRAESKEQRASDTSSEYHQHAAITARPACPLSAFNCESPSPDLFVPLAEALFIPYPCPVPELGLGVACGQLPTLNLSSLILLRLPSTVHNPNVSHASSIDNCSSPWHNNSSILSCLRAPLTRPVFNSQQPGPDSAPRPHQQAML